MATTDDIDTKTAVSKFLSSASVVDKEDPASNNADEIQAVLESVVLSFLLYPQAALSFVLQAKNILQQVASTDLKVVTYLRKAIDDLENPDEPVTDTSDLINAQSALVEVDRLGRVADDVRAYTRYTAAINNFLDTKLAKALKRNRRGEFERTGTEAKQDLFRVFSVFAPTHAVVISKLGTLLAGVSDFNSVALTKMVATKAVARVRSSLAKIVAGTKNNQLSKTAIAIELLAGASALSSISNTRKINDPTIASGTLPAGRTLLLSSERPPANARGVSTTVDLGALPTPWVFELTTEPLTGGATAYALELPVTGASDRAYVKSSSGGSTFDLSTDHTLYVEFGGITPPVNQPVMVRTVVLPTGSSVSIADVLTALNDGTTGLIDGTAVEFAPGKILIYGSSSVTYITIRGSVPGTFDLSGNYLPADSSAHAVLGFTTDQTSADPSKFTPAEIVELLSPSIPTAELSLDDETLVVSSLSTELLSSLSFGGVASSFGFSSSYISNPGYLEIVENGVAVDPSTVGVFVGSVVAASDVALSARTMLAPILAIDGTRLYFASSTLPRCANASARVLSPLVYAVQQLYDDLRPFDGSFDKDGLRLQQVLSPLLSRPTLAQINDAKQALEDIQTNLENFVAVLAATSVRSDRSEFGVVASKITAALEERGLDRALALLQSCQFSSFFALTSEDASKGTRFLKASEQVGRNDLAQTTAEQDIVDLVPKATSPDQNLLPGEELLENEEQQ